jgi:hypothetical protein
MAGQSIVPLKDLRAARVIGRRQKLTGYYRGRRYEATVLDDCSIKLGDNGPTFRSLSAAASHITGRSANGWRFWKVDVGGRRPRPIMRLREQALASGLVDSSDPPA